MSMSIYVWTWQIKQPSILDWIINGIRLICDERNHVFSLPPDGKWKYIFRYFDRITTSSFHILAKSTLLKVVGQDQSNSDVRLRSFKTKQVLQSIIICIDFCITFQLHFWYFWHILCQSVINLVFIYFLFSCRYDGIYSNI